MEYLVLPQTVYWELSGVFVRTVIASSVGLPVRCAEMSGFGGLDYDVLNVSPCEKRTEKRRQTQKHT